MKNLRLIITLIILVIIGLFAAKTIFKKPFEYAGTIEATRIDLPARVPTIVKSIHVEEGQSVKKDQIVAELACEDILLNYKLIQENFERAFKLKQTGAISKEAYDQSHNKKLEVETKLSWCEIKSPVDGTILTKFLEPSEWANPGTKILTVADLKNLWTYFYVSQETMSQLKIGLIVTGSIPELKKTAKGQIIKINEEAEFTPKNVQTQTERTRLVFGIKVAFKNEDGFLKPGMTILSNLNSNQINDRN